MFCFRKIRLQTRFAARGCPRHLIYPSRVPPQFGKFFRRHISRMQTTLTLIRFHYVAHSRTRLPFRPFERSMSCQTTFLGLFTMFHAFLFLSLSPLSLCKHRNSVGSASAVFFPPLRNCVIGAK